MPISFSILVPVYNSEKYLHKCINSVLTQTYPNFELILIDDGSTDGSGKLCDEFSTKDNRIIVFHQENKGQLMARRKGIDSANGDYCLFLDSDDYWDPNLLETIANTIYATNCDMILFKFRHVSETGMLISESSAVFPDNTVFTTENKELLIQKVIGGTSLNNLANKVIKRECIDNSDYTEYQYIRHGEDFLQSLPFLFAAQKIVYLDRSFYNYRYNSESVTNKFDTQQFKDSTIVRHVAIQYMISKGYDTEQSLKNPYCAYIRCLLSYEFELMNTALPYKQKKLLLNEIHALPLYNQAIAYFDNQYFTVSERIRFTIFHKRHYIRLFGVCKIVYHLKNLTSILRKLS